METVAVTEQDAKSFIEQMPWNIEGVPKDQIEAAKQFELDALLLFIRWAETQKKEMKNEHSKTSI